MMKALRMTASILLVFFVAQVQVKAEDQPWIGKVEVSKILTGSSPDNTYQLLKDLIKSAKKSISISVYQIDNPFLGDALEDALDRGIKVRLLLEGAPIPKVPQTELYIAKRLVKKGAKVRFYHIENGRKEREFKYFHNKFCVVDSKRVLVGSANYGNNGHPKDPTQGNREWEIGLESEEIAKLYEAAFKHDAAEEDQWAAYGSSEKYTLEDPGYEPDRKVRSGQYDLDLKPVVDHDVTAWTLFAPDNSLKKNGPMFGPLDSAKESILVEQLNFETFWGVKDYNPEREDSPMMTSIIERAREGVAVRILLNDDDVFRQKAADLFSQLGGKNFTQGLSSPLDVLAAFIDDPGPLPLDRDNKATRDVLNRLAKKEGLDMKVRLMNFRDCGIKVLHNKGFVVDNTYTMVGSLNWGESALKFNREAGVVVKSKAAAGYYTQAFRYDWECSGQ